MAQHSPHLPQQTPGDEVSSLKEQLEELRQEYDDFVESSSQLEAELEASVEALHARLHEAENTERLLSDEIGDLQTQLLASEAKQKNGDTAQVSVEALHARLHEAENTERLLSDEIGDLIESALQQKRDLVAQERVAALQHAAEIKDLQAQLARAQALVDAAEADAAISAELIRALESDVEDTGIRLTLEMQQKADYQVQAARERKTCAELRGQLVQEGEQKDALTAQVQELLKEKEKCWKAVEDHSASASTSAVPVSVPVPMPEPSSTAAASMDTAEMTGGELARYKAALEKAVVKLKQQKVQIDSDYEKLQEISAGLQDTSQRLLQAQAQAQSQAQAHAAAEEKSASARAALEVQLNEARFKQAEAEKSVVEALAQAQAAVAATATTGAEGGGGANPNSDASSSVGSPQHTASDQMSEMRDRHKQREETLQEEIKSLHSELAQFAEVKEIQSHWAKLELHRTQQIEQLKLALEKKAEQIQQIQQDFTTATAEVQDAQAEYVHELEEKLSSSEKRIARYEIDEKDLHHLLQQWNAKGAAWDSERAAFQQKTTSLQEQCVVLQSAGNAATLAHAASVAALTRQLAQASAGLLDAHELVESLEAEAQLSQKKARENQMRMRTNTCENTGETAQAPDWKEQYDHLRERHSTLQTQLQNIRGNILVCCRARPSNSLEISRAERISVDASDGSELSFLDRKAGTWRSFKFDRVWGATADQSDVFADVEPVALSVLDGYNACVLAYGQTGSGKTYTMQGGNGSDFTVCSEHRHGHPSQSHNHDSTHTHNNTDKWHRDWHGEEFSSQMSSFAADKDGRCEGGIAQRSITRLFQVLKTKELATRRERFRKQTRALNQARIASGTTNESTSSQSNGSATSSSDADVEAGDAESSCSFTVHLSVLEVYNESVRDLLANGPSESLELRQAPDGSVAAVGMVRESVKSAAAALAACARAAQKRATGTTKLNEYSSRSHVITLLEVHTFDGAAPTINGVELVPKTSGKLYLVDLAGSERVQKSGVSGAMMREAQNINKSLSALGDVMEALDKRQSHVPYRNSKLTYLLHEALGGSARTLMAVTICPTEAHEEETLFALQFSSRVRNISYTQTALKKNTVSGTQVKNLQDALKAAQREIKLSKEARVATEDVLQESKRELREASKRIAVLNDSNCRITDDEKKSQLLYAEKLSRTADELRARAAVEKEARAALEGRVEQLSKEVKIAERLAREFSKERDAVTALLRVREQELNAFKTRRIDSANANTHGNSNSRSAGINTSASTTAATNSVAYHASSGIPAAQPARVRFSSSSNGPSHISIHGNYDRDRDMSVSPVSGLLRPPPSPPPPTRISVSGSPASSRAGISHQSNADIASPSSAAGRSNKIPRTTITANIENSSNNDTTLNSNQKMSHNTSTPGLNARGREAFARHTSRRANASHAGKAGRRLAGFD